jgi:hypothetical protein
MICERSPLLSAGAAERMLLKLLDVVLCRPAGGAVAVGDLVELLESRGIAVFVAGGAVRDCLIGRSPKDIDLCVSGDIASTCHHIRMAFGPGMVQGCNENFGVCRLGAADSIHLDVAMMRDIRSAEGGTSLFEIVWAPSDSLSSEASVRDFTINALFWRRPAGILDPTGRGLSDLEARRLSISMHPLKADIDHRLPLRIALFACRGFAPDGGCLDYFRRTIDAAVARFGGSIEAYIDELTSGDRTLLEQVRAFADLHGASAPTMDRLRLPADNCARGHGGAYVLRTG